MSRINEDNIFTETQAAVKIYHIFMKNCHPTLAMELRQKFGFPGEASPDLKELLQPVRRLEGSLPETKPKVQVNAATVQEPLTDTQLDQIAEKVASKLQAVRKPKICYRCGQGGHLARSCRNEPNPKKVAEEREEKRSVVVTEELAATKSEHEAKLRTAVDFLENSTLKPVRLRANICVTVPSSSTVELRGCSSSKINQILPRDSNTGLPEGLKITEATIQESVNGECQQVILTVFNSSRRDVKLTAETVLAELSADSELLEALVGPACETAIRIEGIETPCLLDSGSQ
jgi:hypothetical protein